MKELIQISNVAFPHAKTFGSLYYRGENISDDEDYLVFLKDLLLMSLLIVQIFSLYLRIKDWSLLINWRVPIIL